MRVQSNLIGLRKENKISQKKLAKELNINVASYINKELGKSEFKLSEMYKISDYFGKSMEDIFLRN